MKVTSSLDILLSWGIRTVQHDLCLYTLHVTQTTVCSNRCGVSQKEIWIWSTDRQFCVETSANIKLREQKFRRFLEMKAGWDQTSTHRKRYHTHSTLIESQHEMMWDQSEMILWAVFMFFCCDVILTCFSRRSLDWTLLIKRVLKPNLTHVFLVFFDAPVLLQHTHDL